MEIFKNTNFDFLGKKWPFIIVSLVLTAVGIVSLVAKGGPRYGIDFTGGVEATVRFQQRPPIEQVRKALAQKLEGEIEVTEVANSQEVLIRAELRSTEEGSQEKIRAGILSALSENFGRNAPGKVNINGANVDELLGALRGPLASAGSNLSEADLRTVLTRVNEFRNTPPQSGLLTSIDQLSQVEGVTPQIRQVMKDQLVLSPYVLREFGSVGPKIGAELRDRAMLATLYALAGMLVYIAFRFEWIYGLAAVIAVFHDTIITVGLFSLFNKDITLTVVAALLTLIGYSMNDTIVVFDRIRENLKVDRKNDYHTIVNNSINQTLSRTIMVSGLTLLTALALWIFGGPVLNGFSFALVVGIIVGTYSSIFIASPLLIFWRDFMEGRKKASPAATAKAR